MMEAAIKAGGLRNPEEAKLRLGEAYAVAGKKQQAIAALKTVGGKDGTAELARYWIMAVNHPTVVSVMVDGIAVHRYVAIGQNAAFGRRFCLIGSGITRPTPSAAIHSSMQRRFAAQFPYNQAFGAAYRQHGAQPEPD